MTLRLVKGNIPGSDNDGFNREKDPIVMFMGYIGVPRKKLVKGNECFIFYFCVLGSAGYRKICHFR